MENTAAILSDLMLDLSLASALPMASEGRNMIRITASVNAIGCISKDLAPKELRALEYSIAPLLTLMASDIDEPLAVKAAFALKTLMSSRVCMKQLIDCDGLVIIGKIFDTLLSVSRNLDLIIESVNRSLLEHLAAVYKTVSLFYPWEIVRVGAIRHCVTLLKRGGLTLKTNGAGALAALSNDLAICKQMFANGAVKPIINISDAEITNEPCMLAGLGCITQFARIYDIGIKMARQGVVAVLEKGLRRETGHVPRVIREKSLYALAWLAKLTPIRPFISTPAMLAGIVKQFSIGTIGSKYQGIQILLYLHSSYGVEREKKLMRENRDELLKLLYKGDSEWQHRNLTVKGFCVFFRDDEDKMYFVQKGLLETIFDIIVSKPDDLQEANLVLLLSLCSHPDIPDMIINRGGADLVASILAVATMTVIKDLAMVLLKTLALYQWDVVEESVLRKIPPERADLRKLESPECTFFGSEFGLFIQEYLQRIINNRRNQKYLLLQFTDTNIDDLGITPPLLLAYQKGFMELDQACRGFLEVDALKVIMVLLGEQMDDEELQDIFDEYDPDLTGRMDFVAFIALMKGWKSKFGFGAVGLINQVTKRGMIGRARRAFGEWWYKNKMARDEIAKLKIRQEKDRVKTRELAGKYIVNDRIQQQREQEVSRRQHTSVEAVKRITEG